MSSCLRLWRESRQMCRSLHMNKCKEESWSRVRMSSCLRLWRESRPWCRSLHVLVKRASRAGNPREEGIIPRTEVGSTCWACPGNSWTNANTTRRQSWETVDSKGTDPRTEPAQFVGFSGGRSWSPAVFPEPLNLAGAERSWMLGRMRQVKRLRSGRTGVIF